MILLGFRKSGWKRYPLAIKLEHLLHHQHIIGATGTGKTTLMANEMVQAFECRACCIVIDPHGDLSVNAARAVNPADLGRVYLLDPLRVKFSFNPLELEEYKNRELAAERMVGEITAFFRKFYGRRYWGPSLNRIFQDGLRALYERDDAPTLKDLYDLVSGKIDHEFREELKKLPRGRTDAVLNKLAPFVNNRFLKNVLCKKPSSVRMQDLIKPGNLVLFRLPRGELSETITTLLGSAVITRVWLSAISRDEIFPVLLFIDEFQLFSHLETAGNIISEGRKYGIGLILAHQHSKQLSEAMLNDVMGNAGLRVVFRVSGDDARLIAKSFGKEEIAERLAALPDRRAFVHLRSEGKIAEIHTLPLFCRNSLVEKVLERMRSLYEISEEEIPDEPEMYVLINLLIDGGKSMRELFEEYRKRRQGVTAGYISALVERAENLSFVTRRIERIGKGRPRIMVELSEKGKKLCLGEAGAREGGELHLKLARAYAERLRQNGWAVIFPFQAGRRSEADMLAYRFEEGWKEIAIEVEVRADHPEQVMKNYEKNVRAGREVIFVVPDEKVKERVEKILGNREKYSVVVLKE